MSRRLGHSQPKGQRTPDLIAMEDQVQAVVRAAGFPLATAQVGRGLRLVLRTALLGAAPADLVCAGPARRRWPGPSSARAPLAQQRLLEIGMTAMPSSTTPEGALVELGQRVPTRLPDADGDGRLLLARAADVAAQSRPSPKTRQDYAGIYNRLIRWLADGLGRAPYREDLTLEVLLAWRNHRERSGGHGGQGLAPASLRVEAAAVRVLLRQLGMRHRRRVDHRGAPPGPAGHDHAGGL